MTSHRLEVADVFRQHKQEFFARWGHTLSAQQSKVFRDICACRTAALGALFAQCNRCSYQSIEFHSCRNRHCPKCQSTARERWLIQTAKELLPVPYSHVVFTLPGALSPLVLQNTKLIYNLLFRCVSETLLTIVRDKRRLGADLGFLAGSIPGIKGTKRHRELFGQFDPVRTVHCLFSPEMASIRRGCNDPTVIRFGFFRDFRITAPGDSRHRFEFLHGRKYVLAGKIGCKPRTKAQRVMPIRQLNVFDARVEAGPRLWVHEQ